MLYRHYHRIFHLDSWSLDSILSLPLIEMYLLSSLRRSDVA
jgi:hypothetical protein